MILSGRRAKPPADGPLPLGSTLAGYRIERELGAGGMGVVYEATQTSLDRRVALKVIAPRADNAVLRERFRREGPLQAVMEHPHILPVYEAGEDHGQLFIAMRLVRGQTLKQIAVARSCELGQMLGMLGDVAGAIDAAHAAGLVHRDVKPQNVLVESGDHAYLADFGLSKAVGVETLTHAGQLLGSVQYMSPEQVRGDTVTAASDVYSFACVVYECLTGLVPFPREDDVAVLHAHVWDPRPRPSEIRPELPTAVDAVIEAGMARYPDDRTASARELMRGLHAALGHELLALPPEEPVTIARESGLEHRFAAAPREPAATEPLPRRRGRAGRATAIAAVVAIVVGGGAGGAVERLRTPAQAEANRPAGKHQPVPDASYANALSAAIATLDRAQALGAKDLRAAKSPRAQAAALGDIARAFGRAQRAIAAVSIPRDVRQANAAIAAALGRYASAYRRLSTAAHRRDHAAYHRAEATLAGAVRAFGTGTSTLRIHGYNVR